MLTDALPQFSVRRQVCKEHYDTGKEEDTGEEEISEEETLS
jgi:hypothetical protein